METKYDIVDYLVTNCYLTKCFMGYIKIMIMMIRVQNYTRGGGNEENISSHDYARLQYNIWSSKDSIHSVILMPGSLSGIA